MGIKDLLLKLFAPLLLRIIKFLRPPVKGTDLDPNDLVGKPEKDSDNNQYQ